jgi:hypothetical protein
MSAIPAAQFEVVFTQNCAAGMRSVYKKRRLGVFFVDVFYVAERMTIRTTMSNVATKTAAANKPATTKCAGLSP